MRRPCGRTVRVGRRPPRRGAPSSAQSPPLRRSLRNTVHRVPPKWEGGPEAELWVAPPAHSSTLRLLPDGGAAPWTCRARLGWTSCRCLCRTCRICWTCWLSWTEPRVAARGAVSLTERGLLSRSSPCYLHCGRVGWAPPAGRGGWRCGRRRRREAGHGAARRTSGVPSRPAAARGAPPAAASRRPLSPASFACPPPHPPPVVASPHETSDGHRHYSNRHQDDPSLAAHSDCREALDQHGACQRSLEHETQTVGAIDQSGREVEEGEESCCLGDLRTSESRCVQEAAHVSGVGQHQEGHPGPRANSLRPHRVVHAVDQHAPDQAECKDWHDHSPDKHRRQLCRRSERGPDCEAEQESHQESVARKGEAEEMRCKGQLVQRVCEGARDRMHCDGDRRRRLEVWVVLAPRGVAGEQRRRPLHGRLFGPRIDVSYCRGEEV
eukprot:scaffold32566_cov60-Phaeocystis_antarctica.AAC.3